MFFVFRCLVPPLFLLFWFLRQPWAKVVATTKNVPFPQLSMLFSGMRCKEPKDNIIETGGRVIFKCRLCNVKREWFLPKYYVLGCCEFRKIIKNTYSSADWKEGIKCCHFICSCYGWSKCIMKIPQFDFRGNCFAFLYC